MVARRGAKRNEITHPVLPKSNSLEGGLFLPLKTTSVATLVGKGVFKVSDLSHRPDGSKDAFL